RGDIFGGNVAAALASAAPLEKIVGEEADMSLDVVGTNALHGGDGRRGKVRTEVLFGARLYWFFLRRHSLHRHCGDWEQNGGEHGNSANQQAGHPEALVVTEYSRI